MTQQASNNSAHVLGEPCPTCGVIRRADSSMDSIGGHPLHVEGGSDLAWKLVADLHLLHLRLAETVKDLRLAERQRDHELDMAGELA